MHDWEPQMVQELAGHCRSLLWKDASIVFYFTTSSCLPHVLLKKRTRESENERERELYFYEEKH